jgi:hypothetical protein
MDLNVNVVGLFYQQIWNGLLHEGHKETEKEQNWNVEK